MGATPYSGMDVNKSVEEIQQDLITSLNLENNQLRKDLVNTEGMSRGWKGWCDIWKNRTEDYMNRVDEEQKKNIKLEEMVAAEKDIASGWKGARNILKKRVEFLEGECQSYQNGTAILNQKKEIDKLQGHIAHAEGDARHWEGARNIWKRRCDDLKEKAASFEQIKLDLQAAYAEAKYKAEYTERCNQVQQADSRSRIIAKLIKENESLAAEMVKMTANMLAGETTARFDREDNEALKVGIADLKAELHNIKSVVNFCEGALSGALVAGDKP